MPTISKAKAVEVSKDPDNNHTLILDRWPTEREKTKTFRDKLSKLRAKS